MSDPTTQLEAIDPTSAGASAAVLTQGQRLQRLAIRLFMCFICAAVLIDTAPNSLRFLSGAKLKLTPWLNRMGLWQGGWTLFAPNPGINNTWISAEVYAPDGQLDTWNSTYWADTNGWQRFRGFRHINYTNRIQTQGKAAADDYADYLARQLISPTASAIIAEPEQLATSIDADSQSHWRLQLARNRMNISLPDDGTLPSREETMWISSSENLTVREYLP